MKKAITRILALGLLVGAQAQAAPQLSIEQATKIASGYLAQGGYAKDHYISALVLEPSTVLRKEFHWVAQWSPAIKLAERRETGLEIAMDGAYARVVTKSASESAAQLSRQGARNIRRGFSVLRCGMRYPVRCFIGMLLAVLGLAGVGYAERWELIRGKIARNFPGVERISTQELALWIERQPPPPVILDVRTEAEFAVSHLAGARRVEPGSDPGSEPLPIALRKDTPIVTYCSVGYRSAAFAERLKAAGYTRVRNLDGSIFQWANEGRPLWRGDQATHKVHPYNAIWGTLLNAEYRASVPDAD